MVYKHIAHFTATYNFLNTKAYNFLYLLANLCIFLAFYNNYLQFVINLYILYVISFFLTDNFVKNDVTFLVQSYPNFMSVYKKTNHRFGSKGNTINMKIHSNVASTKFRFCCLLYMKISSS